MAKPYIYKGCLGHWIALFPDNYRPKFNTWQEAIGAALAR